MAYKKLLIFIEGDRDRDFLEKIFSPLINRIYTTIEYYPYAQKKLESTGRYIKSIKSPAMNGDYIYVRDINNSPCVSKIKEKLKKVVKNIEPEKIVIVIKEIESWYLAGIPENKIDEFKIQKLRYKNTNELTKEDFYEIFNQSGFDSEIDFREEILKCYDIETGKRKNRSFRYFIEKYTQ